MMLLYPVKISLQMIFTNCSDLLRGNPKHIGGGGGRMGGGVTRDFSKHLLPLICGGKNSILN